MYLIDTNIHAAYLLQNFETDALTKQYLSMYSQMKLAERVIPDFILGEFETFIMQVVPSRYRLNLEDKQKLQDLALSYINRLTRECPLIVPTTETVHMARDIYVDNVHTHYLSFIDCLLLATARERELPIFTRDRRMNTIASKLNISVHEPHAP
jgi:predicted nucleic acid-binding protein